MSRVANTPIAIPSGVEIKLEAQRLSVKGPKGEMQLNVHPQVEVAQDGDELKVNMREGSVGTAMAGTMRALVNNLVTGVTEGFEKKLSIVGVGYRAQAQGKNLNLSLGFSHPVNYALPEGIEGVAPAQTEIIDKGMNKQQVGQVAAEIRAFRPPEPYKGKGIRYADEYVHRKQAKKK